jgi:choline dehydrogenase
MKILKYFFVLTLFSFTSTQLMAEKCRSWDYIIVGNGTAGATLARELSDGNRNSVLVLEWGKNLTNDPAVLSPEVFAFSGPLTNDPLYAVNPIITINFPSMAPQYFIYSDGRMWGGSSAHNGLFAVRGTPKVYNDWAALSGQPRWNYNNMLPLFIATEHYTPNGTIADPAQRGLNGPLFITQRPPVTGDVFAQGLSTATGTPFADDYNNPAQGGDLCVSAHQEWITPLPDSHRSFSSNAFTNVGDIVDAEGFGLNGRKLRIVSDALVDKVIFKNKTAIGVQYYSAGDVNRVVFVEAKKKVILAAGAPRTPGILERSGVGDAALLTSLDIPVVVDNPNVGEHLFNHYGAIGIFLGTTTGVPFVDAFTDNGFGDGVRRIQMICYTPPSSGIVITAGGIVSTKSQGSVHIVSANPTFEPRIDLNMYSDGPVGTVDTDAYNVVTYLKTLPAISLATGFPLLSPPASVYLGGDAALLSYAQTLSNMIITYHIVGTTRMGLSAVDSVVDGNLHVFGVNRLMVADVSIEPEIQDGNTAYAAYFIGQQAAIIIKSGG